MLKRYLLPLLLLTFLSCKKEIKPIPSPPKPDGDTRTTEEKLRDSIYYYYKELSFWEESIPVYHPISDISDKYSSNDGLLSHLMSLTPVKSDYVYHAANKPVSNYTGPLDRFSWIEDIGSNSSRSSSRADTFIGFGLFVVFTSDAATAPLYIGMVEGGSPAEKAGFKRGDRISQMNDLTTITYSQRNQVRSELDESILKLRVIRDGKEIEHTITSEEYDIFPVLKDSIYQVNGTNVGYFAYSSFEEMRDDRGLNTPMYNAMETAFSKFSSGSNKISKIIVDLRYNTGGYVSTAIYLANKLVNNSGAGKLMFSYEVNKNLQELKTGQNNEFSDVNFNKLNNTEITDIYFLVSDYTASAAEIVISAMKPYAKVHLISEVGSTYGKPVGFFRQDIMGKAGLWAASFKIVNADGYTDYWDGIPADKATDKQWVVDDVRYDFGDLRETMLATAINHIKVGNYSLGGAAAKASIRTNEQVLSRPIPVQKLRERNMLKD